VVIYVKLIKRGLKLGKREQAMPVRVSVLGGGPGGYVAAVRAAQKGADVTLVEKGDLGGTCVNLGCIPSKVMKVTAEYMEMLHRAREFGIVVGEPIGIAMGTLMERKERILQIQRGGIEALLRKWKVHVIHGKGYIQGAKRLKVKEGEGKEHTISWDRLIIATGSHPVGIPDIPFDGKRIISSDGALSLKDVPASLVIVGGGVIGCEFATIFSAFGTHVTVVEALDRLLPLPSVDKSCSRTLQREMKKRKIAFYVNSIVEGVTDAGEDLAVHLMPSPYGKWERKKVDKPVTLKTEKVLICIGRGPNTEGAGIETLGVETTPKGWIRVNSRMETNIKDVYAIGDVLGPENVMLAHVASAEGITAAENALGGDWEMRYEAVPGAIFTTPEVADVGLTETQARERGRNIRADTTLFRINGKALALGEIAGEVKIVSDADSGKILGVHMIGPHVTDLIAEGALAVQTGCTVEELARTIHAHPTLSETMLEASYKALDQGIHG